MPATTAIWSAVILVGALVALWATVTRSDHIHDNVSDDPPVRSAERVAKDVFGSEP